ncbi:MAG TPA: DUF2017 family protein [Tessaracoccus flavescens]|uniref:DUF2017 family protein n=1 Tax=Tessaracoccus flavescens TaxID=399497 RepID=A0A921EPM5_9ACTN|nr:DUF2017 family protein [Tessaracoccus flavescens]
MLDPHDIIWAYDGRDGRADGLEAMIGIYVQNLETLLPPESDDPFEQIVADLADDPTNRMLSNSRLVRLFPPARTDDKAADEFWRDSIHSQTRARITSANAVVTALNAWDGYVPVELQQADDWVKTLGALRLFWYTELAGTDRLAEIDPDLLARNPGVEDLIEWMGYLLEDLLESRSTCLRLAASLDPSDFEPAE